MGAANDPAAIARRWFDEVWNERRDDSVDELMSPDARGHIEGGEAHGPEDFRRMRAMFVAALPDVRIEVEDVVADGERAAVRWRAVGTHAGDGFGFPATRQQVHVRGTTWMVIRNGRIVEGWDTWNLGGLLESLRASLG
ncbi:MAG TPA: ester cyclase [Thermoanaerobaculia bacterium]